MRTTVFYCKPKGHPFPIFSWLIRLIQNTGWSHTASTCEYTVGVLDATSHGVQINDWADFLSRYTIVEEHEIELDVTLEDWWRWFNKMHSKKYAYMQNVGYILKLLKIIKSNPFGKESAKVNCSELQALQIELGGHDIDDSDEYDLLMLDSLIKRVK